VSCSAIQMYLRDIMGSLETCAFRGGEHISGAAVHREGDGEGVRV
jgi:hypothetical protein